MTIKRMNRGKSHSYVNTETGQKVSGVTTILSKGMPKPALVNWAANATIDYAIDHWDELSKMTPSARAKALSRARFEDRDMAANRGREVHKLAERLIHGELVAVPEELVDYVDSYVRFLDEFRAVPIRTEFTVYNSSHDYCGTSDLLAQLVDPQNPDSEPLTWLLDIKTNRSGVFPETALQLAAYRWADTLIHGDGSTSSMPPVEMTGAVWVRPDGYDLIPIETERHQLETFLHVKRIAEFDEYGRDLIGEPVAPLRISTFALHRKWEPSDSEVPF
jgi:hypothetical protein